MQVERRDRAAGALPVAFRPRDQHDRAVEALDEPRRDDADHAFVPALAGDDVCAIAHAAPRATSRPAPPPRGRCAPRRPAARGSAPRASFASRRASSASSVSSSSSAARGWPRRPAALMRGPSRKPHAPASTVAGSTPAARMSACRPGFCVRASARSPAIASARFSSSERNDVGDRGERDQVEMPPRHVGVDAEERLAELVDDAGAAELGERIVGRPRCDDRAIGQRPSPGRWWSVTITSSPRAFASATSATAVMPQSTVSTRPQPSSASRAERRARDAVALVEAAREVPVDVGAELAQQQHRERRRRDAVDVVVAVHADAAAVGDRGPDALAREPHVAEREGIVTRVSRPRGTPAPASGSVVPRRTRTLAVSSLMPSASASSDCVRCGHGRIVQVPSFIVEITVRRRRTASGNAQ